MEGACNRPFGDGPPSDIRSYPFQLDRSDIERTRRQLNIIKAKLGSSQVFTPYKFSL
jgi:hypothetical protein